MMMMTMMTILLEIGMRSWKSPIKKLFPLRQQILQDVIAFIFDGENVMLIMMIQMIQNQRNN